jgi:hypothetical protein
VQDLRFRANNLLAGAKSAARWLRTTGDGRAPAASGIGGPSQGEQRFRSEAVRFYPDA